ncbi:PEP-utilizing enzyme [Phenylobacterium sp. LH3H17]|uniref:PEP-utilizing enzyme n=1 Tax=Phenylobacterium sp. LH3H17 TaxID=2903901 RepID=UPI0020C98EE2|nr:PEP-utilizing enzyme [Phenylobacterium sp. LH3H17]UTP39785.1 PEP-utilizing enzyme [Phenylobacterium sp. LH3H17]
MNQVKKYSLPCKPACGGQATGRPVVVSGPQDLAQVGAGDILVALETNIAFVPAMHRAAAIVTEQGGRFCHAAVWARENDKPTVLQATDATQLLLGVMLVCVDADRGMIEWEG